MSDGVHPSAYSAPCTKCIPRHGRQACVSSVYMRGRKPVLTLATCLKQTDDVVDYKTSSTDVAFIGMCRKAYGRIAGTYIHFFVLVYNV